MIYYSIFGKKTSLHAVDILHVRYVSLIVVECFIAFNSVNVCVATTWHNTACELTKLARP